LVILVVAFTVHEFAHAYVANLFGDDTPRLQGRLTLNPLVHLDPLGSLMLLVVGFGWARPVQVNPYLLRRRAPSAMMWVSLAGPLSNLLLAVVASIPFQFDLIGMQLGVNRFFPSLDFFLREFIFINLLLLFFNLIPLAPLDGEKILMYFLPPSGQDFMDRIRPYSVYILLAAMLLGIFGRIIIPPTALLYGLLTG
jgi:Zn-dependent protease